MKGPLSADRLFFIGVQYPVASVLRPTGMHTKLEWAEAHSYSKIKARFRPANTPWSAYSLPRGSTGADFFISALVFTAGFVLFTAMGYIWPLPIIPDALLAQFPPDPLADPTSLPGMLNQLIWVLPVAGTVTFVLGLVARRT